MAAYRRGIRKRHKNRLRPAPQGVDLITAIQPTMANLDHCPNCNSKIKRTKLLEESIINKINHHRKQGSATAYCEKCGPEELKSAQTYNENLIQQKQHEASKHLDYIPILTTHTPYKWEYDALGIVTGQSTLGTGVMAEFKSGFTDLFGAQSKTYNTKLRAGETVCLNQLRFQALCMGGNAVIAADIDYSELGSLKGMIMVCASGTAVKLKNTNLLSSKSQEKLKEIEGYLQGTKEAIDNLQEILAILNSILPESNVYI